MRLHSLQGQRDTQPYWPLSSARQEPALSLTGSGAQVKMKLLQGGEVEEGVRAPEHFADEVESAFLTLCVLSPHRSG